MPSEVCSCTVDDVGAELDSSVDVVSSLLASSEYMLVKVEEIDSVAEELSCGIFLQETQTIAIIRESIKTIIFFIL